ncbi:MAG TPA: type II toxin-antitoxin system PemK/MazF family toxin [Tepidisphaeraceae bacterium]|jgi:mRNA interferase MazF|nr:type II toxin-antitoxin system PemK/MazF family toxin [Tepidisphaeraceae bacterium]
MTIYDPGTIVLVRFPFTDLTSTKKRPALVVSPLGYSRRFGDIVLMALTSQDQSDPSLSLAEWRAAGLPKPTWIKPLIGTLSVSLIERRLGAIDARDHQCIRAALAILLKTDWS